MVAVLWIDRIDVDVDEGIRAVLKLTCFPIVTVLARAATSVAAAIAITTLPAVVKREQINVFVVGEDASIFRKWRILTVVEAIVP